MIELRNPLLGPRLAPTDSPFDPARAAREIEHCLERDDCRQLETWLADALAADVADAFTHLDAAHAARALLLLAPAERAAVFGYLPLDMQSALVALLPRAPLTELLEHMSSDERADLFNDLPPALRDQVLPALAQAEREDIRRLSAYGRDTAGAIMTSDYAALAPGLTAREAVEELRRVAPDTETIYTAYVIDDERRLIGVTSLRSLITAAPETRVSELMQANPIVARVGDDQEVVAERIRRYDFIALPILDDDGRLVGIVTADDAMDVVQAEATEDALLAGGTAGRLAGTVRGASIRQLYRLRVFWLVLLVFGNIFSGAGIAHFEDTIASHLALLFFLPLLIASAGNAGSQSATLMVRALATGDVRAQDWSRMLGREILVAGLLGVTMAVAISAIGVWRGGPDIALVVAITMLVVVLIGSLIGMSLPFALSQFRLDPATASGPLVTSIADVAGVLVYFGIASVVLGS